MLGSITGPLIVCGINTCMTVADESIVHLLILSRYFEAYDMVAEDSRTTQLEWKENIAKCTTSREIGTCRL